MSLISAIVLTYNKAWIFPTFLSSLKRQMRKPDEVIFVDDCSSDNTPQLIGPMQPNWNKVLLSHNTGQSNARNHGLNHATGDLVIFLDGDLEMRKDMLFLMEKNLISHPEASFVYCQYDRGGSRKGTVRSMHWNAKKLLKSNYISTMSMVRRAHLPSPPFDPQLSRYEDWDLWLRMSKAGRRGVFIDQVLFTAHYNRTDLSGKGESLEWYKRVLKKHNLKA